MKKKFKLLTSIASLGLALALMTFGVLAAASHSLTVNNWVNFDVGDNISFTISGTATGGSKMDEQEVLATDGAGTLQAWTPYAEGSAVTVSVENKVITWVFTITNTGENDIEVSVASSALPGYFTNETLAIVEEDTTVAADGEAHTITVQYTGSGDATSQTSVEATEANLVYTLTLEQA